jgi:hypothetical protein
VSKISWGALVIIMATFVSITPAFAVTELERATIEDPRLENAFGIPIIDNVNVHQQIQISSDITNNQMKSQTFVYLVQLKNEEGFVVSVGWISGQLTPDQKLNPSLSWTPVNSGEFTAEIFVWEGLQNQRALTENITLPVNVS